MANIRKYEKYISTSPRSALPPYAAVRTGQSSFPIYCDVRENALCPHFMEAIMNYETMRGGANGDIINLPDGQQGRFFPHKHANTEIFHWIGTDPDHPDDLGGTHEMWIGEGEEAEGVWITKPSTVVVPAGVTHLPFAIREMHRPYLSLTIIDSPLKASIQVPKVPPSFKVEGQPGEPTPKLQKYTKCFNENDVTDAVIFPSHKGKSHVALLHDYKQNELTSHFIEVDMIYGAGIGWGCGDTMQVPNSQLTGVITRRRSLPIMHAVTATYAFISMTDRDHIDDLGGTVEFWIGEGAEAEQYIITKPTCIFIPPSMVHLPMYVREVHKPFVMVIILDTPLWAGVYTKNFPPDFNHVGE